MESLTEQLVRDWIQYHHLPGDAQGMSDLRRAEYEVSNLARSDPARCMRIISEIFRRDRSKEIIEGLAAGPLEDLLLHHGITGARLFEQEAMNLPDLIVLLGGVWDADFDEETSNWLSRSRDIQW